MIEIERDIFTSKGNLCKMGITFFFDCTMIYMLRKVINNFICEEDIKVRTNFIYRKKNMLKSLDVLFTHNIEEKIVPHVIKLGK